jgi:RimJ/RimL family protein N-acetyltransferase
MMIVAERLVLRRWAARDRAPFAALNADVWDPPLTTAESDALVDRLEARWEEDGFAFAAAERREDGAFVGMVGLQRFPGRGALGPCVEVGWRLAREHWGRGYATEAGQAWIDHGFGPLGLAEIVAFTDAGNARSLAVMRRLGMRRDAARDFLHPEAPELGPLLVHALRAGAEASA